MKIDYRHILLDICYLLGILVLPWYVMFVIGAVLFLYLSPWYEGVGLMVLGSILYFGTALGPWYIAVAGIPIVLLVLGVYLRSLIR